MKLTRSCRCVRDSATPPPPPRGGGRIHLAIVACGGGGSGRHGGHASELRAGTDASPEQSDTLNRHCSPLYTWGSMIWGGYCLKRARCGHRMAAPDERCLW